MITENKKECMVCISSHQVGADGESQSMEIKSRGRLFKRGSVLSVLYEENEKVGEQIRTLLKIEEEPLRVSIRKSGAVIWNAVFEAGKKDISAYETPYGALELEVETKTVNVWQTKQKTSLQLAYALLIQGEKQADCRLELDIDIK